MKIISALKVTIESNTTGWMRVCPKNAILILKRWHSKLCIVGVTSRKSLQSNGLTFDVSVYGMRPYVDAATDVTVYAAVTVGGCAVLHCVPLSHTKLFCAHSPTCLCYFRGYISLIFSVSRFSRSVCITLCSSMLFKIWSLVFIQISKKFLYKIRNASRSAKFVEQTGYDWIKILLHIDEGTFSVFSRMTTLAFACRWILPHTTGVYLLLFVQR